MSKYKEDMSWSDFFLVVGLSGIVIGMLWAISNDLESINNTLKLLIERH